MGLINILPQDLINQIAAGEVIERPASVVKELLENALDAQAQSIRIEIEGGGIELIRVADDGLAMEEEDLELAVLRHATSKIQSQSDLFSIHTLGFRGEALPSILSVSRATISTRTARSPNGFSLTIEAGHIVDKMMKGMPEGTIVEVKDLFFNTPARKKFLKTTATEQRHIIDIISRYAIAYPSRRFLLSMNGRTVLNLRENSNLEERVKSIWGKGLDNKLKTFSEQRPAINIHGIIATPDETRPNRSGIYTYVNNRSVRDQTLTAAVIEGYRGMLMKQRFPLATLFIDIEPSEVDVNVHPAKAEVRFKKTSAVFGSVAKTIRETITRTHKESITIPEAKTDQYQVREHIPQHYSSGSEPKLPETALFQPNLFVETNTRYSDTSVIGTLHNTYILLEDDSSLYILDQHAAHERITYERLKKLHEAAGTRAQMLLTPLVLELSPVEYSAFEEIAEYVPQLGIETAPFGDNTLAVRSIPFMLEKGDMKRIILDLINEVLQGNLKKDDYMHGILSTIACHRSIRSGDMLSRPEITALLRDLDENDSPHTCPHGRPLFKKIAIDEIERWIGRRP
jgi:DNA mismatch repair protein MutL